MKRKLNIGTSRFIEVFCTDESGQGGACHEYHIKKAPTDDSNLPHVFGTVSFQNGPIKDFGINGCHQEDLLAIVIDRLHFFQAGTFSCRENALALTKLEEAMHWLNHRTTDRQAHGVEGANQHRK